MVPAGRVLLCGRNFLARASAASRPLVRAGIRDIFRIRGRRLLKPSLLTAATLALGLIAAGPAILIYHLYTLPLPDGFEEPRRVALDLASSEGSVFAVRGVSSGRTVELADVPEHLVDAVLTMEDRRFFAHAGFDLRGVARAAVTNLIAGETVQGGSTITQQLAKNLFLSPERTFARKIQEALLAIWLERRLTKEEILARYLNTVYLGAGAYGVDAASRRYFGKPVEDLSLAEAAMLAGLIQAPSRFAPTSSPEAAHERARIVLDAMDASGAITAEAAKAAKANPAELALPPREQLAFGYAADWAASEARAMLGDASGDFTVRTTIEPRLQILAQRALEEWLAREGDEQKAHQAALVAMAPDGAILALAGGRDYGQSQFNRATQAERQPGSVFKLFVYLAALQDGMTPQAGYRTRRCGSGTGSRRTMPTVTSAGPRSGSPLPDRSTPPPSGCRNGSGASGSWHSRSGWGSTRRWRRIRASPSAAWR